VAGYRHDHKGRSTHTPRQSRLAKANRPPDGEPWVWITLEMMASAAFAGLNLAARRIHDRLLIEHMSHAGKENGKLVVTYSDFVHFGLRRASIADGIRALEASGLIAIVERGRRTSADFKFPSRYRLTHLPSADGTPATNEWRRLGEFSKPDAKSSPDPDAEARLATLRMTQNAVRNEPFP
jgi:hypothetical protein